MTDPQDTRPDPNSHRTGWKAKKIDGHWRVGMNGTLDTKHDAVLTVNSGPLGGDENAERLAVWVAEKYNAAQPSGSVSKESPTELLEENMRKREFFRQKRKAAKELWHGEHKDSRDEYLALCDVVTFTISDEFSEPDVNKAELCLVLGASLGILSKAVTQIDFLKDQLKRRKKLDLGSEI